MASGDAEVSEHDIAGIDDRARRRQGRQRRMGCGARRRCRLQRLRVCGHKAASRSQTDRCQRSSKRLPSLLTPPSMAIRQ